MEFQSIFRGRVCQPGILDCCHYVCVPLEPRADKKLSTLYRFALFLTSVAVVAGVTILNLTIFWLSSNSDALDNVVTGGVPLVSEITVFLLPCLGVFLLAVGFLIGLSRLKSKQHFRDGSYSDEELVEGALKNYVPV